MKIGCLTLCGLTLTLQAQSTLDWGNRIPGVLLAPIYAADPANPTAPRTGNTPAGLPAGTQTYAGPLLAGSGYSAQLYVGPAGAVETSLTPWSAAVGFGNGAGAGYYGPVSPATPPLGSTFTAQLRVWDNRGGSLITWGSVLAEPSVARGTSDLLTIDLTSFMPGQTPYLLGLESFQLYSVPEPSAFALAVLGAGGLLALRRTFRPEQ